MTKTPIVLKDYKKAKIMQKELFKLKASFSRFLTDIETKKQYKSVQRIFNQVQNEILQIDKDLEYLEENLKR